MGSLSPSHLGLVLSSTAVLQDISNKESHLERLRSQRDSLFKQAKMDGIPLVLLEGDLNDLSDTPQHDADEEAQTPMHHVVGSEAPSLRDLTSFFLILWLSLSSYMFIFSFCPFSLLFVFSCSYAW